MYDKFTPYSHCPYVKTIFLKSRIKSFKPTKFIPCIQLVIKD